MTKIKSVKDTFLYYKQMEKTCPSSSMLMEIQYQYCSMAAGKDGGVLGYKPDDWEGHCGEMGPSCREYNYPNYPDEFFQSVCALMGWKW